MKMKNHSSQTSQTSQTRGLFKWRNQIWTSKNR